MRARSLSLFVAALSVAYVAVAAVRASGGALHAWLALVLAPLGLWLLGWRRPVDDLEPPRRLALRACAWGAAVVLAARAAPAGRSGFDAVVAAGTGVASVAGLLALARIPAQPGLLGVRAAARRLDAAGAVAAIASLAAMLALARALVPARTSLLDPRAIDEATWAAAAGSLALTVSAAARARRLRRLELDAGDRAQVALSAAVAALVVGAAVALLGIVAPSRALPWAALAGAAAVTLASTLADASAIVRAQRVVLAVTLLGVPAALMAAAVAREAPEAAPIAALATTAFGVLVGLFAHSVARPFAAERGLWLTALTSAEDAVRASPPEVAVTAALVALRRAWPDAEPSAAAWLTAPPRASMVDRAGYPHALSERLPDDLGRLAASEPERTLRVEVLAALEVRRPDLRPLLGWMREHGAASATVLLDDDGPAGALLLPAAARRSPLTVEEARAARRLADALAGVLAVDAALARSRDRERAESARADEASARAEVAAREASLALERRAHDVARMAHRVRRALYSPAARIALEAIERVATRGVPLALLAPPGVDAAPWAACAHLAGPRHAGPFVVVDAADAADTGLVRWSDANTSPLALALGGTLVVIAVDALGADVQDAIAEALAPRDDAGDAPLGLVVASSHTVDVLVASGRITDALADALGDRPVALPPLAARAEDLRGLVLAALSRHGLHQRGEALGISAPALAALLEHAWPGNDAELESTLVRLARAATGDRVEPRDLAAIGFTPQRVASGYTPEPPAIVVPRVRRASPRKRP